jgi:hypothetical protein
MPGIEFMFEPLSFKAYVVDEVMFDDASGPGDENSTKAKDDKIKDPIKKVERNL